MFNLTLPHGPQVPNNANYLPNSPKLIYQTCALCTLPL